MADDPILQALIAKLEEGLKPQMEQYLAKHTKSLEKTMRGLPEEAQKSKMEGWQEIMASERATQPKSRAAAAITAFSQKIPDAQNLWKSAQDLTPYERCSRKINDGYRWLAVKDVYQPWYKHHYLRSTFYELMRFVGQMREAQDKSEEEKVALLHNKLDRGGKKDKKRGKRGSRRDVKFGCRGAELNDKAIAVGGKWNEVDAKWMEVEARWKEVEKSSLGAELTRTRRRRPGTRR